MEDAYAIDQWFDLTLEILGRLRRGLDLAGQHEAHPCAPRHLDGEVLSFVGTDARKTQQKWDLLRRRDQQPVDIDGVVNCASPREIRKGSALRFADGDEGGVTDGRRVEGCIGFR